MWSVLLILAALALSILATVFGIIVVDDTVKDKTKGIAALIWLAAMFLSILAAYGAGRLT